MPMPPPAPSAVLPLMIPPDMVSVTLPTVAMPPPPWGVIPSRSIFVLVAVLLEIVPPQIFTVLLPVA